MVWENKTVYWKWKEHRDVNDKGEYDHLPPKPTEKKFDYVIVGSRHKHLKHPENTAPAHTKLLIGVWDGDKYTPLNRDELEFKLNTFVWDDIDPKDMPLTGVLVKRNKTEFPKSKQLPVNWFNRILAILKKHFN